MFCFTKQTLLITVLENISNFFFKNMLTFSSNCSCEFCFILSLLRNEQLEMKMLLTIGLLFNCSHLRISVYRHKSELHHTTQCLATKYFFLISYSLWVSRATHPFYSPIVALCSWRRIKTSFQLWNQLIYVWCFSWWCNIYVCFK